ncbi:MAG: dTDP-4-dehydrorhamnose reductase [Crocinitomicaceae bacterium]|nr:dTDP-4-dehydrorhamnose reductase [Crocinitomicaceae bacterium]
MKKKFWVIGAKGQLGSELEAITKEFSSFIFTDINQLDICDFTSAQHFVAEHQIEGIINCAAYTAVDKAEEQQALANAVNHLAVKNLAEIAREKNIPLIHISTDYVFDGKGSSPYPTNYPIAPVSVYGKTKADGEKAIVDSGANAVIIRTAWVYSVFGHNFVKTMLRLGQEKPALNVVADQIGSPTNAADLAKFIVENLLDYQPSGTEIYHYTNEGACSWYDFAHAIMELKNLNCVVNPIPTKDYPTPAKRPFYSVLDKESTKQKFNITIPHWRDSLKQCLKSL